MFRTITYTLQAEIACSIRQTEFDRVHCILFVLYNYAASDRSVPNASGMTDVPKDLLRAINMHDFPERLSDNTGGLGNMPELTLLLEDDEVVKKFSVSLKYLII